MKRFALLVCALFLCLSACALPPESNTIGVATDTTQAETTGSPSASLPADSASSLPADSECPYCGQLEGNDRWFIARVMENGMVMPLGTDCFEATSAMDVGITLHYSAVDGDETRRLAVGEIVRITYNGCIMETYPVQIRADSVTVEAEVEVVIETDEDGDQYLVLPVSGERVLIWDNQKPYVKDIDGYLLRAAEEKITEEVSGYSNNGGFDLQVYKGYLCLYVEVIVKLDPPAPDISVDGTADYVLNGCGIDHEHRFFSERITK